MGGTRQLHVLEAVLGLGGEWMTAPGQHDLKGLELSKVSKLFMLRDHEIITNH